MKITSITQYSLAFLFSESLTEVALLIKNKPAYLANLLNGIGGHVEPGESALEAIIREVKEESDLDIKENELIEYAELTGWDKDDSRFSVRIFTGITDLSLAKTMTEEPIVIMDVAELSITRNVAPNLKWLVHMAESILKGEIPRDNYYTTYFDPIDEG